MTVIEQEGLTFPFSCSRALAERDLSSFRVNVLHTDEFEPSAKRLGCHSNAPIQAANVSKFDGGNTHPTSPRNSAANA